MMKFPLPFSVLMEKLGLIEYEMTGIIILFLNGKESQRYDFVDIPRFNPNSNLIIFKAMLNEKYFLVVNGIENKPYDNISGLVFNPVTNDFAYWAERDNRYFLVVNDTEVNYNSRKPVNEILFGQNGISFAYTISENNGSKEQHYVILNDVYGKPYDRVRWTESKFGSDGKTFVYPAGKGNNEFMVLNQKEEPYYESVKTSGFQQ